MKRVTSAKIKVWPLPLDEHFQKNLNSNFADLANISSGRAAGTIIAGTFLANFTKAYPWHIWILQEPHGAQAKIKGQQADLSHCWRSF